MIAAIYRNIGESNRGLTPKIERALLQAMLCVDKHARPWPRLPVTTDHTRPKTRAVRTVREVGVKELRQKQVMRAIVQGHHSVDAIAGATGLTVYQAKERCKELLADGMVSMSRVKEIRIGTKSWVKNYCLTEAGRSAVTET